MANGGGDHGSEKEGREIGKARSEEEGGCKARQEAREEVVLPVACPGVDKDKAYLVGAGNIAIITLPSELITLPSELKEGQEHHIKSMEARVRKMALLDGFSHEDVVVASEYGDEDEAMRTVREVNEDPHDVLKVTIQKQIPAYVDQITISFETESE